MQALDNLNSAVSNLLAKMEAQRKVLADKDAQIADLKAQVAFGLEGVSPAIQAAAESVTAATAKF